MRRRRVDAKHSSGAAAQSLGLAPRTRSPKRSRDCAFLLLFWVAVLVATVSASAANRAGKPLPELTLTVCLYNYAKVPDGDMRRAENEARRVIESADVETIWLDCTASSPASRPYPGNLYHECTGSPVAGRIVTLRVLNRLEYKGAKLSSGAVGYANRPILAAVLYDRLEAIADRDGYAEDAPVLLGDIMAHELGHLFLGPTGHSPIGIMRGRWDATQLRHAVQGTLKFTSEESSEIRGVIEAGTELQRPLEVSLAPHFRRERHSGSGAAD